MHKTRHVPPSLSIATLLLIFLYLAPALAQLPQIRGIKYRPVPLGSQKGIRGLGDVYTSSFSFHHKRDLTKLSLSGANTLFLQEWNVHNSHKSFLDLVRENGLKIVPTFPLDSNHYPDIFSESGRGYVAGEFEKFLEDIRGYEDLIEMVQLGSGPNRPRSYGGYQPVDGYFAFIDVLATVKAAAGVPALKFYVALSPEDSLDSLIGIAQLYEDSPVDVWGLGSHYDWKPLRRIVAFEALNNTNVMVEAYMSSFDSVNHRQNESLQVLGLQSQYNNIMRYSENAIYGIVILEWSDVYTADPEGGGDASEFSPLGYINHNFDGITKQYYAQGRSCLTGKEAYNWLALQWGGQAWTGSECYGVNELIPLLFILGCLALGVIGLVLICCATCCVVRRHAKNANVRYIPPPPDTRTDPYIININEALDSLYDAVTLGNSSVGVDVLIAGITSSINQMHASLTKMITSVRTREAVDDRCESLRRMNSALSSSAQLALRTDPCDEEAVREVKKIIGFMREELAELEKIRDSDIRMEFGMSLRATRPAPAMRAGQPGTGALRGKASAINRRTSVSNLDV